VTGSFSEKLESVFNILPNSHIKILFRDFNNKVAGKSFSNQQLGASLHEINNDNGVRVENLATSKNTTVRSTMFPHRKSYPCKRPWRPIWFWDVEAPTFSRQLAHRWRWSCQPYAPAALYSQEDSWYSFLLEAEMTRGSYCGWRVWVNWKIQWTHWQSIQRPSYLEHGASTNYATACPLPNRNIRKFTWTSGARLHFDR
jgi:hypothetical protein